ncbi:MAG: hypothetical protein AABW82_01980 [Nanoarchaeota archaeon]
MLKRNILDEPIDLNANFYKPLARRLATVFRNPNALGGLEEIFPNNEPIVTNRDLLRVVGVLSREDLLPERIDPVLTHKFQNLPYVGAHTAKFLSEYVVDNGLVKYIPVK